MRAGDGSTVAVYGSDDQSVDSVHSNSTGPVVVLVGVPGAGKSTVGLALAQRLGVGFRDTDADVESTTGRAISDIFVESGEPEFRRMEAAAVAEALDEHPGVLAVGGGAVTDAGTRALLAGRSVVWLRVGLAAASQRAGLSGARPVLLGNVRAQMKALMDGRAPLYDEVARLVVDSDELTVDATVDAILSGLGLIAATAESADTADAGTAGTAVTSGAGSGGAADVRTAGTAATSGAGTADVPVSDISDVVAAERPEVTPEPEVRP